MINERILNEFRQHNTTPEYIMLITDIQNGEVVCNEESLIISAKQIYTSLDSYINEIINVLKENDINPLEMDEYFNTLPRQDSKKIEDYLKAINNYVLNDNERKLKTIDKELTIYSNISLDDNNLYYGQLNGYISKEETEYNVINSKTQSSHYIEVVDTVLQKTIDITFKNGPYTQQPKVYITIDKEYENLYRDYDISFMKTIEGGQETFYGVQIIFNNLKNKNTYPSIGIVIIGDEKSEEHDGEGDVKPNYYNLTVNLYYDKVDKETGVIEEVPIENIPILINDKQYTLDTCGSVTTKLPEGEYDIRIGENGYKYTPETVVLDSDKSIGLKIYSLVIATFSTINNNIRLKGGWNGVIDWGDGDIETISDNSIPNHNYIDSEQSHTIKIKTLDFKEAFRGATNLTSIDIPLYSVGSLSEQAFENCTNLESVNIQENIEVLGENCFASCTNLASITLPESLLTIEQFCFSHCASLNNVVLPNNIIELGKNCFVGCESLSSIVLSNKLEIIGKQCFANDTSLMQINIPKKVSFIGDYCFSASSIRDIDIILNWTDDDIKEYSANIWGNTRPKFIIPNGTIDKYIMRGYPQDKLRESE